MELNAKQKYDVAIEMSKAVYYLHKHGISHRDIKPENILLCDQWKLCDFGLSKAKVESMLSYKGTSYYMAPEMLGEKYDQSVDVFALGIVFLELYLGKRINKILKSDQL